MYAKIIGTEFHLIFKNSREFFERNYIYPPRVYVETSLFTSSIKIEFKWNYKHNSIENSTRCYICGDTILVHIDGKVHPCRCGCAEKIVPQLLIKTGNYVAPLNFNGFGIFEIPWSSIPPELKEAIDYHKVVTYYYNNSEEELVIEIPNGVFDSKLLTHICYYCGNPRAYKNRGCNCLSAVSIETHDRRRNFLKSSCYKTTQVENCIVGI